MATLSSSGYEVDWFTGGSLIRYSQFAGQSFVTPFYFGTLDSPIILNSGWTSPTVSLLAIWYARPSVICLPCRLQQFYVGGFTRYACAYLPLSPLMSPIALHRLAMFSLRCNNLKLMGLSWCLLRLVFCLTSAETKYKTILEYTLGLSREIRLDCAFVSVVGLEMQHSAAKSRWVVFLRATNIRAAMFVTWG